MRVLLRSLRIPVRNEVRIIRCRAAGTKSPDSHKIKMTRQFAVLARSDHQLPEYKRGGNNGIALVACKGEMGTVIPQLIGGGGKTGCQ